MKRDVGSDLRLPAAFRRACWLLVVFLAVLGIDSLVVLVLVLVLVLAAVPWERGAVMAWLPTWRRRS
jgi:hypothetical protein